MDQQKIMVQLVIVVIFICLPFSRASSSDIRRYSDLFIDCGALTQNNVSDQSIVKWQTDGQFIEKGENKLLPSNTVSIELTTLRFFPEGNKNCYKLPFYNSYRKYIFRATFYYGNYDGLSKPPSFGLEFNGKLWANVTTSTSEEPVIYELIYIIKKDEVEVCLVRTNEDDTPFISSLEAIIAYDAYNMMDNNTALYLHSRINYGANASVEKTMGYYEEHYQRFWKSKEMPNYLNIHAKTVPTGYISVENNPPWAVMAYAIQAHNLTDSLYLPVDFPSQTPLQAYFVFYFLDPLYRFYPNNLTSKVEIYIDNKKMGASVVPNGSLYYDMCRMVSLYPIQVSGSANVTIAPAEGSTLPPILNAMEVFSNIDLSKGGRMYDFPALSTVFLLLVGFLVL
ncbi:hypothetical protein LguiB_000898 [Lonicera macranthoides]